MPQRGAAYQPGVKPWDRNYEGVLEERRIFPNISRIIRRGLVINPISSDRGTLQRKRGQAQGLPLRIPEFVSATDLQPADEEFAFVDHLRRQSIVEFDEELFVTKDLFAPGSAIEGL